MKRLLTIGHSYGVAMNRLLPEAIARAGGWQVTVAAPDRVLTDRGLAAVQPARDPAVRLVPVPVHRPGRVHWMGYGRALRDLLAEEWDVVHCWQEPFVWSAGQVARWAPPGAALVYSTFQNLPKRYPPPFSSIERSVLRRADGWIAFGESVAGALRGRAGYRERPHRVIPPPVDLTRFRPDAAARRRVREGLGWADPGTPVVGYVGRLVPEKGIRLLLAALEGLEATRVLIVGDGPMRAEVARWVESRPGRGRLVSGAAHDEVPDLLAAMDVLVLPSLTTARWREQFGRVLAEAMASGVAVIGSDSGEIPHVLGDAGLVVPEGDVRAWAGAVRRLAEDAELRAALAERGLRRAGERFDPARVAAAHLEFYDALRGGS